MSANRLEVCQRRRSFASHCRVCLLKKHCYTTSSPSKTTRCSALLATQRWAVKRVEISMTLRPKTFLSQDFQKSHFFTCSSTPNRATGVFCLLRGSTYVCVCDCFRHTSHSKLIWFLSCFYWSNSFFWYFLFFIAFPRFIILDQYV